MMKSYEKGKLPQIIWGSKSADRVGTELKSADVQKCLIVSGSHVIKHPITQKIIHSLESIGIPCDVLTGYCRNLPILCVSKLHRKSSAITTTVFWALAAAVLWMRQKQLL